MTSESQFNAQLWQQVDEYFRQFIRETKPNNLSHALRLQITRLSYAILGHRYLLIWARKNARLHAFLSHFDL